MFLVATIQFFISPRKALQETYDVLVSPTPRIVKGHLVLPHNKQSQKTRHDLGRENKPYGETAQPRQNY